MTEEASQLAREAKSLQQTLKESLKSKDPWDRETDFTRKQLRRNCLRLLLLHPYEPESKDVENTLWMQTSYAFISVFKQRIAHLDRAIHNSTRQQPQQQTQGQPQQQQQQGGRGHGAVEYRKLLQRFRQFLAEEDKFWVQLIVRIRRIFALDDAHAVLAELGLFPDESPAGEGNAPPKRNHFQFPSEADIAAAAPSLTPTNREQRESRMAILSKALVCLGDIERYKEQYNESGGRPRAGHEDGPPAAGGGGNQKGGRGKKGGAGANGAQAPVMPRMRNYDKAQQCYQQARILLPQDGNPAHQMAILASYQKDVFGSLVHYYRALCVRNPYDTAAENLGTVLSKTLMQWKNRGSKREKDREQARGEGSGMAPRLRVEAFKEKLIVLHALWRVSPEEADSISPDLGPKLAEDFKSLISERVLPPDIILKAVILAQSALWKHRMFRTSSTNGHKKGQSVASSAAVESTIASHLLAMHRMLLEVGIVQIAEAPPEDAGEHDLAQHITAAFRRTLPALRMASKWIRANLRYITQSGQQDGNAIKAKGRDRRRGGERRSSSMSLMTPIPGLAEFWYTYAQFSTALLRAFPPEKLPVLATTLEEDVEMAGFLPLKKFVPIEVVGVAPVKEGTKNARSGHAIVMQTLLPPEQVHPNEEQLMRIADLLADAQALANDETSPLVLEGGKFTAKGLPERSKDSGPARTNSQQAHVQIRSKQPRSPVASRQSTMMPTRIPHEVRPIETDDDNMTDITRTEDDPVEAAFRTVLGASTDAEDDDDDQIVWNPRNPARDPGTVTMTPAALPASPPRPFITSPTVPALSPHSPESLSPKFLPSAVGTAPLPGASTVVPSARITTAQDILANVLHPSPPKGNLTRPLHMRQVSAPQTHMLFGSSAVGSGPSIWSSSANETAALNLHTSTSATNGLAYQPSHSQTLPQPPSSLPFPTQASLGLGHPSVPLGTAHQYNASQIPSSYSHQRVQSYSVPRSQPPSSQGQSLSQFSDSFGSYPALTEKAPISLNTGVPSAYADPVFAPRLDTSYPRQDPSRVPERSIPYHIDPRMSSSQQGGYPPLSAMAQLWNV